MLEQPGGWFSLSVGFDLDGERLDLLPILAKLLEDGTLEELPRMGAKSIKNIREAVDFAKHAAQRTRLGDTMPIAEQIIDHLKATVEVGRVVTSLTDIVAGEKN